MTIHVNIGEAKTRLSQLIAAAEKGEEVIIDRDGEPAVRLVRADGFDSIAEARRAAFGVWKGLLDDEIDWLAPAYSDEEWEKILSEDDELLFPSGDDETAD